MEDDYANQDHLGFRNDKAIKQIIGDIDKLLLSDKVIKVNRYGISQDRNIIVTEKNIYNLKKKNYEKKNTFRYYFRHNSK